MKAFLLVFGFFLLSNLEGALPIPEGGITYELIGSEKIKELELSESKKEKIASEEEVIAKEDQSQEKEVAEEISVEPREEEVVETSEVQERKEVVVDSPQFQEEVYILDADLTYEGVNFESKEKIAKKASTSDEDIAKEAFVEETPSETEFVDDDSMQFEDEEENVASQEEVEEEPVYSEQVDSDQVFLNEEEFMERNETLADEVSTHEIEFEDSSNKVNSYTARCFKEEEPCEVFETCFDYSDPYCDPQKKWYFTLKPGYFYFKDNDMKHFFDGGFTIRAETGRRFWDYYMVWIDAGYFQKKGSSIGGTESLKVKLATITLGLKGIYYFNNWSAIYGGLGPRLFMMLLHNSSPFVRSDDNEIGIGGGFQVGFWFFPAPQWENLYLDVFADYGMKNLHVEPDEISSIDNDVDVSGLTAGVGIGFRF